MSPQPACKNPRLKGLSADVQTVPLRQGAVCSEPASPCKPQTCLLPLHLAMSQEGTSSLLTALQNKQYLCSLTVSYSPELKIPNLYHGCYTIPDATLYIGGMWATACTQVCISISSFKSVEICFKTFF